MDGAIIAIDKAEHRGELSFLYVKVGIQSKGIGQAIWNAIEALHPETEVWEKRMEFFFLSMIYPIFTLINSIKREICYFLSIFSKKNIIFAFVFKSSSRRERKNPANGYLGDMEQKMELTAFVKWNLNQFSGTFSLSQKSIDKLA